MRNSIPLEAVDYGKEAIKLSKKYKNYTELAKTYSFMGVLYRNAGNFDQALVYYNLGLDVAEENNLEEQLGYAHINFGNWFIYSEKYAESLYHLEKALAIAEKNNNKSMISYCNLNIGRTFLLINEPDTALIFFNKALSIRFINGNSTGQSICYKFIADVYKNKKEYDTALKIYETAYDKADRKFDLDLVADIYNKQAQIYLILGNVSKANQIANLGIEVSLQTKSPVRIRHAYESLSIIKQKLGFYKEALQYRDFVKLYNDSFYLEQLSEKISNVKFELESKKQKTKIDSLSKAQKIQALTIRNTKIERTSLIVALILLITIIGFVTFYSIQRKKANKLLKTQKDEISLQNSDLFNKNEEIKTQRDEIQKQNSAIENQQVKITDSIIYAQRIQEAVLPPSKIFKEIFPYHFILFKPRDIVSGDFYWIKKIDKYVIVTAADSTGHGIPGAFVSMLGMSLLNKIVVSNNNISASGILEELRSHIKYSLRQSSDKDSQDDGMDMALCVINTETLETQFAGANNPLYIIRNNELQIINATPNPVGIYFREKEFKNNIVQLQKNDTIYMFSDGYSDQFGGPENRRFMTSKFRKLLLNIQKYPMAAQQNILEAKFNEWKGNYRQIDDILVMGIKMSF